MSPFSSLKKWRGELVAIVWALIVGNSFYLLFCCSEFVPLNDWIVNSIYKTMIMVGVTGAKISLAQRTGNGCFNTGPEIIPQWALVLERTAIPIIESLVTISLSLICYSLIRFWFGESRSPGTREGILRRDQFAHRQLFRSGVLGISAGSLLFLILNSEIVSLRLLFAYLRVLSAIGLPGANEAASFYGFVFSKGSQPSTPPIWSVIFGAIIVPHMHLTLGILISVTVLIAVHRSSMRGRFPPLCHYCGYSLRGVEHVRCPECGTAILVAQGSHLVE